jgi:hypothetical protein
MHGNDLLKDFVYNNAQKLSSNFYINNNYFLKIIYIMIFLEYRVVIVIMFKLIDNNIFLINYILKLSFPN